MKQRHRDFEYVSNLFKDVTRITGTILKIDVDEGFNNYANTIGDPMKEETLILGDADNNVIMCFKPQNDIRKRGKILDGVNIVPYFKYEKECLVHKMREPRELPSRLVNIMFQTNVHITNITNNLSKINLEQHEQESSVANTERPKQSQDFVSTDFMSTHYNVGGMIPIKDVKRNPEWRDEYLEHITTKLVNVCKSCRKRAYKGCCFDYSANNRTKVKMVVGWSAP